MCDPVSLAAATFAVGSASAVMGFQGQNASSQANAHAANEGAALDYNSLGARDEQIGQQQSENTVSALIDKAMAQGKISSTAAAFGTDASTATAEENAVANQEGRALSISNLNSQSQRNQTADELAASRASQAARISSVPRGNPLSLALGIAKAGLGATGMYGQLGGRFGSTAPKAPGLDDGQ